MTVRQVYENLLMELRKYKAPHLHLDQFLYFLNKGVQEYLNKSYNTYNTSQQMTDALSAVTTSGEVILDWQNNVYTLSVPGQSNVVNPFLSGKKFGYDYVRFALPESYWHILNMFVTSETKRHYKCHPPGYIHNNGAKRLTADAKVAISNNAFLKPDLKRPYFYAQDGLITAQNPDLDIFYGDAAWVRPTMCEFDFLKKPQKLTLTVSERDAIADTSQVVEFPDYVIGEIIKHTVTLLLENAKDPRLNTNNPINQTVKP